MIDKANYNILKEKYGDVASWAIWERPGTTPKSNIDDLSVFNRKDICSLLNTNYVFVGLNASSTHGDVKKDHAAWYNFHSGYSRGNDYKLRFALLDTEFWGGYITDFIKYYPEVDSDKVKAYIRKKPKIVEENAKYLQEELSLLGKNKPVLVALGSDVYSYLKQYFYPEYDIKCIKHFSYRMRKEDYREEVINILSGHQAVEKRTIKQSAVITNPKTIVISESLSLQQLHDKYPSISKFNSKGELSFNHRFKLIYGKREGKITYIYTTNPDILTDFNEFQFLSSTSKEAKAEFNDNLFHKLLKYI